MTPRVRVLGYHGRWQLTRHRRGWRRRLGLAVGGSTTVRWGRRAGGGAIVGTTRAEEEEDERQSDSGTNSGGGTGAKAYWGRRCCVPRNWLCIIQVLVISRIEGMCLSMNMAPIQEDNNGQD
jgi:hypothetical protein